jgi:predicted membrane protein
MYRFKVIFSAIIVMVLIFFEMFLNNVGLMFFTLVLWIVYVMYLYIKRYIDNINYQKYIFEREEENNRNLKIIAENIKNKE